MELEVAAPAPAPNPWLTMWFSPRRTIRRIVDAEVQPSWSPVITVTALGQAAGGLVFDEGSISLSASMMPVAIGVMQIVFGVLVGPFLLAFAGGWLGGDADPSDIRQAIAWAYVPLAVGSAGWIPVLMASGSGPLDFTSPLHWFALPFLLAISVGACWTLVAHVLTLAEVQRFSIWRAIGSILITASPLLLLLLLMAL